VGGGLPLAVGLALADRMQGRPRVTACFFGDGAVAEGEFHESMNLAALWKLPVLFCCENNRYAMGTALERHQSQTDLALKASSYGCRHGRSTAWTCSPSRRPRAGVDLVRGRAGPGVPGAPDLPVPRPLDVRPGPVPHEGRVELWKQRDPIALLAALLREDGHLDDAAPRRWSEEIAAEIDDAVAFADAGTLEPVEDLTRFVYSETARGLP
jgi:pyruvate dehydrogenase E1 component alpha subunit